MQIEQPLARRFSKWGMKLAKAPEVRDVFSVKNTQIDHDNDNDNNNNDDNETTMMTTTRTTTTKLTKVPYV